MKQSTKAVHIGREAEESTGAIIPDIALSTTFVRESDGTYRKGFQYIRSNNPTRERLEKSIASLEGVSKAISFSSGLAAFTAILQTLEQNDHILIPDDMYHGAKESVQMFAKQFGIKVDTCDQQNLKELEKKITKKTTLIWVESPSNPYLKIVDIQAIAELGKKVKALTAVDNTWATPILQNPLTLGADIVMHSTTKYIGGHGDVQGGILIPAESNTDLNEKLKRIQKNYGAVPSPFDCWLLLRSIPTLPIRIKQQCQNAMKIAEYLQSHPKVELVLYPGLQTHINYEVAKKQMNGFGGMISFIVKDQEENFARKIANTTELFKQATSLGGIESLIEHRASVEGPNSKTSKNLLRLSIGLEDVDDLINDLDFAMTLL
jgi:cystathionine gamma-synthase